MFDFDKWQEILATIRKNKLRTFLTMFGVFWGIFMLLVLLGSGKGLESGVKKGFAGWATNSFFVWADKTTLPYGGYQEGRNLRLSTDDLAVLEDKSQYVSVVVPRNQLGGFTVSRNDKAGGFTISGEYPAYTYVKEVPIIRGRWLNPLDIEEKRKVTVIGEQVVNELFEKNEEPLGEYVKLNGVNFQVIGVTKSSSTGNNADRENRAVYTPFSTFQLVFNLGRRVFSFAFLTKPDVIASVAEREVKQILARQHSIHPEDRTAIQGFNLEEEFAKIQGLFTGINAFMWVVGIGTLLAGVIGVSNIMLIVVKERTQEIGVRKAIGATPFSIVSLIMQESITLTMAAGYLGLLVGISLLELIGYVMESGNMEAGMFGSPEIDTPVALGALLILVVGGALAGWLPSQKAASINPIEAIRG